jgi:hypothetical protein
MTRRTNCAYYSPCLGDAAKGNLRELPCKGCHDFCQVSACVPPVYSICSDSAIKRDPEPTPACKPGFKICKECKGELPIADEFYANPHCRDGHDGVCKACRKIRKKRRENER